MQTSGAGEIVTDSTESGRSGDPDILSVGKASMVIDREQRTVQINCESADFEDADWWLVVEELANLGATLQDGEPVYRDGVYTFTASF
jgi:hypothetical protein